MAHKYKDTYMTPQDYKEGNHRSQKTLTKPLKLPPNNQCPQFASIYYGCVVYCLQITLFYPIVL